MTTQDEQTLDIEPQKIKPAIGRLEKISKYMEDHHLLKIWIKLNQSFSIFAFVIAASGFGIAYLKYNEDKHKQKEEKIIREEDRISKAWDTLVNMSSKNSNGGQVNAINILVHGGVSLDRVDLHHTYLAGANLKGASLREADLRGADLRYANLQNANLEGAKIDDTILYGSNLQGANLKQATFINADLAFSKIDISIALSKSLTGTELTGVKIVSSDEKDVSDFTSYFDTIGSSSDADGAQDRINLACANHEYNKKQSPSLPFNLPNHPCFFPKVKYPPIYKSEKNLFSY